MKLFIFSCLLAISFAQTVPGSSPRCPRFPPQRYCPLTRSCVSLFQFEDLCDFEDAFEAGFPLTNFAGPQGPSPYYYSATGDSGPRRWGPPSSTRSHFGPPSWGPHSNSNPHPNPSQMNPSRGGDVGSRGVDVSSTGSQQEQQLTPSDCTNGDTWCPRMKQCMSPTAPNFSYICGYRSYTIPLDPNAPMPDIPTYSTSAPAASQNSNPYGSTPQDSPFGFASHTASRDPPCFRGSRWCAPRHTCVPATFDNSFYENCGSEVDAKDIFFANHFPPRFPPRFLPQPMSVNSGPSNYGQPNYDYMQDNSNSGSYNPPSNSASSSYNSNSGSYKHSSNSASSSYSSDSNSGSFETNSDSASSDSGSASTSNSSPSSSNSADFNSGDTFNTRSSTDSFSSQPSNDANVRFTTNPMPSQPSNYAPTSQNYGPASNMPPPMDPFGGMSPNAGPPCPPRTQWCAPLGHCVDTSTDSFLEGCMSETDSIPELSCEDWELNRAVCGQNRRWCYWDSINGCKDRESFIGLKLKYSLKHSTANKILQSVRRIPEQHNKSPMPVLIILIPGTILLFTFAMQSLLSRRKSCFGLSLMGENLLDQQL